MGEELIKFWLQKVGAHNTETESLLEAIEEELDLAVSDAEEAAEAIRTATDWHQSCLKRVATIACALRHAREARS